VRVQQPEGAQKIEGVVKPGKAKLRSWLLIGVGVLGVVGTVVLIVSQWGTLQPGQATVIGGLGVLAAAGITFFSQHLSRISEATRSEISLCEQQDARTQTDRRERDRALHDRYATAANQLAHEAPSVRLGGVYSLRSLADDWHSLGNDDERQVCIDLLRAHLRLRRAVNAVSEGADAAAAQSRDAEDRYAILRIIANRANLPEDDPRSWVSADTDMQQAALSRLDFPFAKLVGVKLERADLTYGSLDGADLSGAWLNRADLSDATLRGAKLTGANLSYAKLTGANLEEADLSGAALSGANLRGANLNKAKLNGAKLDHANLESAKLMGADLSNATLTPEAHLDNAVLTGAILIGANLKDAYLIGAQLANANFSNAKLNGAHLDRANLKDADLTKAGLTSAVLDDVDLTGAILREATMTDADLNRTRLTRADVTGASLKRVDLTRVRDLTGVDLDTARDLTGAKLSSRT
jgi:uncharacterized protein YjbI with pentapeptide repeats